MENLSVEQRLRKMCEAIVFHTQNVSSTDIDDDDAREAFRVLRNCVDVIVGTAIPEITKEVHNTSRRLGEIHLIYNHLTPAQRGLFESWVFSNHG